MIYDDDSPVTEESEGKEGKEVKVTTTNNQQHQQQTSTIKTTISSTSTIKPETITTNNAPKNITKIEKKLAGKLETLNSDKNITFPGINNINIKSEKASIKNEENYKSKIHRKNCNSEVIRRIILEVFNDNVCN